MRLLEGGKAELRQWAGEKGKGKVYICITKGRDQRTRELNGGRRGGRERERETLMTKEPSSVVRTPA